MYKEGNDMTKKIIKTMVLSMILILGMAFTVNAGIIENSISTRSSWSVASYPGSASSDRASDLRDNKGGTSIYLYTFNYSSESVGMQPIYATSAQSPDRIGINTAELRFMGYNSDVKSDAQVDVDFYAYSSTDRLIANGSIDAK